jgi:hypothetical protein
MTGKGSPKRGSVDDSGRRRHEHGTLNRARPGITLAAVLHVHDAWCPARSWTNRSIRRRCESTQPWRQVEFQEARLLDQRGWLDPRIAWRVSGPGVQRAGHIALEVVKSTAGGRHLGSGFTRAEPRVRLRMSRVRRRAERRRPSGVIAHECTGHAEDERSGSLPSATLDRTMNPTPPR